MSQWNEPLQERWNTLSRKSLEEGLTAEEQQEWAQLEKILETEELEMLQPVLQRYDKRIAELRHVIELANRILRILRL